MKRFLVAALSLNFVLILSAQADCSLAKVFAPALQISTSQKLDLKELLGWEENCDGVELERIKVLSTGGGILTLLVNDQINQGTVQIDRQNYYADSLYFSRSNLELNSNITQRIELDVRPFGNRLIEIVSIEGKPVLRR